MKLKILELQAFGPFASKEVINFDRLGKNPLFLIDGPTGAGKSSILHGICFALYGETTDSERKDLGIRCDLASSDKLTQVTLEFMVKGCIYRITRIPTQPRPSKRGGKETEEKASAHLRQILDDGSERTLVAKKKTEADEKIREIVGLNAEQFRQVMVLPQGKFRELLLAKSDDRQAILSTLFETELYKRIEALLKEKAGGIEKKNREFEARLLEALSDVGVDDQGELTAQIELNQASLASVEGRKNQAHHALQQLLKQEESAKELLTAFTQLDDFSKKLSDKKMESDTVNQKRELISLAVKAAEIMPLWNDCKRLEIEIERLSKSLECASQEIETSSATLAVSEQVLSKAKQDHQQRDGLLSELDTLKGYRSVIGQFEKLKQDCQKADRDQLEAQKAKELDEAEYESLSSSISETEQICSLLEETIGKKSHVFSAFEKVDGLIGKFGALAEIRIKTSKLYESKNESEELLRQAQEDFYLAEKHADTIELSWFSNQAAILASKLEADTPCPVCGSNEHPSPAMFSANAEEVSKIDVEEARVSQREANDIVMSRKKKRDDDSREYEITLKEEAEIVKELGADAGNKIEDLRAELQSHQREIEIIEKAEKEHAELRTNLTQKRKDEPVARTKISKLGDELTLLTAKAASAKTTLEKAESELPDEYRTLQAVEAKEQSITALVKGLDDALADAQNSYLRSQNQLSATTAAKQKTQEEHSKNSADLEGSRKLWMKALNEAFPSFEQFQNSYLDPEKLRGLRQETTEYDKALSSLQGSIAVLSDKTSGLERPVIEVVEASVAKAKESFETEESAFLEQRTVMQRLNDAEIKIRSIQSEQESIREKYEVVGALAKAASGQGNVRVSLERFVLGSLLDSVLSVASQRLHVMSKGQYRLVRRDEQAQKRNVTAGLDLAIDDAHTGKQRPVATLSGGESFMASLSLALALSDVVQQRSGGIQLDTLFIDEGFGSLDQESLQLAINTLVDLQSSGRAIGIISHVSELKEQMALRIDVKGSRDGSSIQFAG
jgi:exonuclease SbcC